MRNNRFNPSLFSKRRKDRSQELKDLDLEEWKYPDYYIGTDYENYFSLYRRNRDSDHLTDSNFYTIIETFKDNHIPVYGYYNMKRREYNHPMVIVIKSSHFACGYIELIMIHKDITDKVFNIVKDIQNSLSDYPILNDDDFYEREAKIINESWNSYIQDEILSDLKNKFDLEDIEIKQGIDFRNFIETKMDEVNTEFITENNGSYIYGKDRVIESITEKELSKYCIIEKRDIEINLYDIDYLYADSRKVYEIYGKYHVKDDNLSSMSQYGDFRIDYNPDNPSDEEILLDQFHKYEDQLFEEIENHIDVRHIKSDIHKSLKLTRITT